MDWDSETQPSALADIRGINERFKPQEEEGQLMILALKCPRCAKYDDWEKIEGYAYCNCGGVYLMSDLSFDNLAHLLLVHPLAEKTVRAPLYLDPDEFYGNEGEDE